MWIKCAIAAYFCVFSIVVRLIGYLLYYIMIRYDAYSHFHEFLNNSIYQCTRKVLHGIVSRYFIIRWNPTSVWKLDWRFSCYLIQDEHLSEILYSGYDFVIKVWKW